MARPSRNEAFTANSRCVPWSRRTNSKMPCLPGFLPVINDDQATAVMGGKVVSSGARAPPAIRRARFGKYPFSISGSSTLNDAPSNPMTNNLLLIIFDPDQVINILARQRIHQLVTSSSLAEAIAVHRARLRGWQTER